MFIASSHLSLNIPQQPALFSGELNSNHFTWNELAFLVKHEFAQLSRLLPSFLSLEGEPALSSLLTGPFSAHNSARELREAEDGFLVH